MAHVQLTDIESGYIDQGYDLPEGWTWDMVHTVRAQHEIREYLVPLPLAGGRVPPCTCWGVPIVNGKFLRRHPDDQ